MILRVFYLIVAALTFYSHHSFSYTYLIGKEQKSCLQCHFSPQGKTGLTLEGRRQNAMRSARAFYANTVSKQQIEEYSLFWHSKKLAENKIYPTLKYRGQYEMDAIGKDEQSTNYDHNDLRAMATYGLGNREQFKLHLSLSYLPDDKKAKSRSYYVSYTFFPQNVFYAGYLSWDEGLGQFNLNTLDLQSHGFQYYALSAGYELNIQALWDEVLKSSQNEQTRFSVGLYKLWAEKLKFGLHASFLDSEYSTTRVYKIQVQSLHSEQASLLFSYAWENSKNSQLTTSIDSFHLLTQARLDMWQGSFFLMNFQADKPDSNTNEWNYQYGPTWQWWPRPKWDIRFDLWHRSTYAKLNGDEQSWLLRGYLNLWI